jgi:membrane protease YdiL (CAAX protease family)
VNGSGRTRIWHPLWHPGAALPLLLIVGPYYLNKLVYLAEPGFTAFAVTDYGDRIVTLGILYLVLRRSPVALAIPWRLAVPSLRGWLAALAGAAILTAADVGSGPLMSWLDTHGFELTHYPSSSDPAMALFDDTVGMVLVGLSEEAVFRFYLINALMLRGAGLGAAMVLSSLVFAGIHWSYGLSALAFALFAGFVLAPIYVATRNLAVPVIAHALYDSIFFFGGVSALRALVYP